MAKINSIFTIVISSILLSSMIFSSNQAFAASTPGETLYGVTSGDDTYEFWRLTDPTVLIIDPDTETLSGIEFDSDGTLYTAGATAGGYDTFGTIDPNDGTYTEIAPNGECSDVGIDPTDGQFYCQDQELLIPIDKITGVASPSIGSTGLTNKQGSAMDIAPDGTFYYGNGDGLYTLDKTDGSATSIASWIFPPEITDNNCRTNAFDFNNFGTLWASLNCNSGYFLVTIDETTAQITFVENTVDLLDGIAFIGNPSVTVGGTLIPIDSVSLILSGSQMSAAWMIPVIVSGIGFAIVIARKL